MKRVVLFGALGGAAMLLLAVGSTSVSAAPAVKYGKCTVTGKYGQFHLTTVTPGVLTDEFTDIVNGFYTGNTVASVDDGYSYCLVANVAYRAGIPKIDLKLVSFDQIIAGHTTGFDVSIDDIFIKPARAKVVSFSIPYKDEYSTLIAPAGSTLTKATVKNATVGVVIGSVQDVYAAQVHAFKTLRVYPDTNSLLAAIMAHQVDGVLLDTSLTLPWVAASHGKLEALANFSVGGQDGVLMPKGSPNVPVMNQILRQMMTDGTLNTLLKKYILPSWGGINPNTLPTWGG